MCVVGGDASPTHLVDLGECTEQCARCRGEAEQAHPLQVQDDGGGHDGLARQSRAGWHELLVEALPGVDVVVEQPPLGGHLGVQEEGGRQGVRTGQGMARHHGMAGNDMAGHGRAGQGRAGQGGAEQGASW